ncbi:MAG: Fe-S cluster assembly protein SufD [Phycisphaerales bacterium]|nr:Fe-S cluster assembly protein SufD [Phycisphaerales bacterium]
MTQLADNPPTDLKRFTQFTVRRQAPSWLDQLRLQGISRFHATGFPHPRDEEWRFTSITPITRGNFIHAPVVSSEAAEGMLTRFSFGEEASAELVFVNGHFAPQLSKMPAAVRKGLTVTCFARAVEAAGEVFRAHLGQYARIESSPFVALNTGAIGDGAFIHIESNTTVEGVIHLLFLTTIPGGEPTVAHPRVLITTGENVEVAVVESYCADAGQYWTNAVTEIAVGAGSRFDHNKLQHESPDAYHTANMVVRLDRGAQFVSHSTTLGGRLTRNDLTCHMAGEGAYATLNGLVLLNGEQHCDNHTMLDHAAPGCPSHELYKHVLRDSASGVFKGKILVRPNAQKTDSKQNSRTLLLSDRATMNSMPALEIYADDVKCTHGSTTGPVDEDMVFYIRSRGLSLDAARHLLTYAFAADVTRRIKVEPVRRRIESHMARQHGLPEDLRIQDLASFDEDVL